MASGFNMGGMFDSILEMFKDPSMDPKLKEDLAMRLDGMGVPPPQGMGGMTGGSMGGAMSMPGMSGGLGGLIGMLGGPKEASGAPTGGPGEPALPPEASPPPESSSTGSGGSAEAGGKNTGQPSALSQGLAAGGQVLAKPPAQQEIPKGVVGGVKAPEHPQANPAFLNMIAALLNHPPGNAATAPGASLGSLIR